MFIEMIREKEGSKQIRRICMFIEKNSKMKAATPAVVECLVNIDISINM